MFLKTRIVYHQVCCECRRVLFDSVRVWQAYILATIMLAFLFLTGCYSTGIQCLTGRPVTCCPSDIPDFPCAKFYVCCTEDWKSNDQCCIEKGGASSKAVNLKQLPVPDLSYTTLDGLVDYGKTTLKVKTSDGDYIETKLKGRVAITGGVCSEPQCPLNVLLLELTPIKDQFTSAQGKSISGVLVRNANTWTGTRLNDGTINMDSTNKLGMEGTIGGEWKASFLNPNAWFKGFIYYNVSRLTDSGSRVNNRIEITGNFADDHVSVTLTFSIWTTNCQPSVFPIAECRPNIESGLPGYVHFDSDFKMLENMQSSQDLCDALLAPKYEDVCTSGGDVEFPTFSCKTQPLPSSNNKVELAELLKFYWKDANGKVFSDKYTADLGRMPVFPVNLTVENKWGRRVSATISDAPVCSPDVALELGACAWEQLSGPQSHQRSDNWCPKGSFLTALDLEGDRSYSAHDAPLVGYARCCAPHKEQSAGWASCSWTPIGRLSHQQGASWCADNAFLTALDLDADQGLSAHDSPIVGQARCCTPIGPAPSETGACSWVEIGRRSHQRDGNWCPTDSYLRALDLDSDYEASAYDSPIVGRTLCCPLGN